MKNPQSPVEVTLPDGSTSKLSAGTQITKVRTFAGRGTNKPVRDAPRLCSQYGGAPSDWGKTRGDGQVDYEGAARHCELHWYASPRQGRVEIQVKRRFDEG